MDRIVKKYIFSLFIGGGESTADVSKSASKLSLDGTTFTAKPTGSSFSFSGGASSSQNITGKH